MESLVELPLTEWRDGRMLTESLSVVETTAEGYGGSMV